MNATVTFPVPEFDGTIIRTTYDNFLSVLKNLCNVRNMLIGKVSYQISRRDVPHFYHLIQSTAEESCVILKQANCPNKI